MTKIGSWATQTLAKSSKRESCYGNRVYTIDKPKSSVVHLYIVAIFHPFSQFCEINVSLLSLQKEPNTAPNLFQRGVEYGKYVVILIIILIIIIITSLREAVPRPRRRAQLRDARLGGTPYNVIIILLKYYYTIWY